MASYPLPPWLSPSAAQGYGQLAGEAARADLSAQLQRDRMAQEATQFAIESQQKSQQVAQENQIAQQQLQYNHQLEQQKIAIENAYKQQNLALQQQDVDTAAGKLTLARDQFNAKTTDAANKFAANQAFQKAMLPADQGGEGLSPTQAALKYLSSSMSSTELGRLAALPTDFKPGATMKIPGASGEGLVQVSPTRWDKYATVPETVTNAPNVMSVNDAEGNELGNVIQIGNNKPFFNKSTSTGTDLASMVRKRQQEMGKSSTTVDKKDDSGKLGKNEVIRIVNGKRAVFDSSTKQFIRWADKEPANAD